MPVEKTASDQAHEAAREYVRLFRRRKWVVLLAVVVVPAVAVALSLQQQKRYRASAQVLLTHQDLAASLLGLPDPNATADPQRLADTQAALARSPAVAADALRAAHLADRTPQQLLDQSSVTARTNEDLLVFSVDDPSPARAIALANAYARAYPRYRLRLSLAAIATAKSAVDAQLASLQAQGRTGQGLYGSLLDKRKELSTLEALQTTSALPARAADSARLVQPRPVRDGFIGLVVGLVLGIGVALLRDTLDARVRTVDELADRLDLPLLARLAPPAGRFSQSPKVTALSDPRGWHAESFRMLRTNLDFVNLDRRARTIMVTSAVEQEGKTTTAANLAAVVASSGKRVVLVDLDLRQPHVHEFLGTPEFPGVTDVALGSASLESALVPIPLWQPAGGPVSLNGAKDEHSLDVLPAGTRPPSIGEFMNARALQEILHELRTRADLVLVDSPPLLRVGDAMALTPAVDAIVLIARLKVVTRPMLADVRRLLERSGTPVLGVVVTGTDPDSRYGRRYGYGYGRDAAAFGARQPRARAR